MVDPALVAVTLVVGAVAGFASGLFGIGGGVIMVPALLYLVLDPGAPGSFFTAKAASLLVITLAALPGVHRHHTHGNVDWRRAALLGAGVLGATVATQLAEVVAESLLRGAFGALLVLAGLRLLYEVKPRPRIHAGRGRDAFTLALGFFGGVVAGFFGVGGGIIMVPGLALAGVPMHTAVATSLVAVFLNSASATANNIYLGYLGEIVRIGLPTAAGALLGIRAGADTANNLPAARLRRAFGVFLALVGAYMAVDAWLL